MAGMFTRFAGTPVPSTFTLGAITWELMVAPTAMHGRGPERRRAGACRAGQQHSLRNSLQHFEAGTEEVRQLELCGDSRPRLSAGRSPAFVRTISHRAFFPGLHVPAQHGIDGALISPAMLPKERQHVGIDAQRDLLLRPRPDDRVRKKVRSLLRNVGVIDVLIPHGVNSFPVGPGSPFRILSVLHDLPSSAK